MLSNVGQYVSTLVTREHLEAGMSKLFLEIFCVCVTVEKLYNLAVVNLNFKRRYYRSLINLWRIVDVVKVFGALTQISS